MYPTINKSVSSVFTLIILQLVILGCNRAEIHDPPELSPKAQLGKRLFFDENLSSPAGQSCASCHDPSVAFTDPDRSLPVSKGAVKRLFGNRNDMTVSYSMYVPPLHFDNLDQEWKGGFFWDGRANSLTEQAMGPPMNPLEMANPDTLAMALKIRALEYAGDFEKIYGTGALSDPGKAFYFMADALSAYEQSHEVNPFSSKFDLWQRGEATFTDQEQRGFMLFSVESKGNCLACHPHTSRERGIPALFTDFTYDNLGAPANPENPFYQLSAEHNPDGFAFRDYGLGGFLKDPSQAGKFRVPTLRNVAITSPYLHNGVFKTLFQVVSFYNTRDVSCWPEAEVPENVNKAEMGNLGLTTQEIEDIVAFLETLTDGWEPD